MCVLCVYYMCVLVCLKQARPIQMSPGPPLDDALAPPLGAVHTWSHAESAPKDGGRAGSLPRLWN
jgi:hypothetical protein